MRSPSRQPRCPALRVLSLICLTLLGPLANAGLTLPIQDHAYDATLFVAPTENEVWPPVGVGSLAEYENVYGQLTDGGTDYGHEAARLFFANGGQTLYMIAPQGETPADFANALAASLELQVDLVVLPGAACCTNSQSHHAAIMATLINHVDASPNRFGLADAPLDMDQDALLDYRSLLSSDHAALYAPWLVLTGAAPGDDRAVPSSPAVAGVISRIDRQQGIFSNPAGIDALLAEPPDIDLERAFSAPEQDLLNLAGINLLREIGSPSAIYVWGARTMSDRPDRRFIIVARFLRHLEYSMRRSLAWISQTAPGEINVSIVELLIEDYLYDYFLEGAFSGVTPSEAYFVDCNSEAPVLACIIGIAMLRPSEFEIIQLDIDYRDDLFRSRFESK